MAEGSGPSNTQAEQQRLLDEAMKQPGVATALAVFANVRRYLPQPASPPQVTTFSTGGNAR